MSKAPAMPMYWDAYLADTTHLTTEEHGAYMLLLAAMWRRNGSVPDDDKDNARILGLTPAKWRKIKARFIATISGFNVSGDTISQEKLQKTWETTQEKITKNKQNGSKGGRAAASKNKDLGQANAANSQERKATIPEPEPEPVKREPKGSLLGFDEFWNVWPIKIGKENARKAWAKLAIEDRRLAFSAIRDGWFNRWQQSQPDANPIHASTFLNSKRWTDEIATPQLKAINGGRNERTSFDTNHREYARLIGSGEIQRGPDPSDPFAGG